MGMYPFMFSKYDDFVPIVEQLTKVCLAHKQSRLEVTSTVVSALTARLQEGFKEPYDWDAYARVYCKPTPPRHRHWFC